MGRTAGLSFVVLLCAGVTNAQEVSCFGAGSIALAVVLTLLCVALSIVILYFVWKKYKQRKGELLPTWKEFLIATEKPLSK